MKRKLLLFSFVFAAFLACSGASVHAMSVDIAESLAKAPEPISVMIDGQQIYSEVPPKIINGSTMIPMRAIFEALGVNVSWDSVNKTVEGVIDSITIRFSIGSRTILVNGEEIELNSPAIIIDGYTFVPVRAVAEIFGYPVEWDESTRTVYLGANAANTDVPQDYGETGDTAADEEYTAPPDYGVWQEERYTPSDAVE